MSQTLTGGPELVLARFSRAVDHRRPEAVAELFTEDGVFRGGAQSICGRGAILTHYQHRLSDPRRVTRHVWSNVDCRLDGESKAHIDAILTNYAFEPAVSETHLQMRIGDLQAICVLQDGQWRFAEHLFTRTFALSLPMGEAPAAASGADR